MRSLDQFGISLNWEFRFFKKDDSLSPLPNQILVDLGNRLDFGVIDTHQGDTPFDSLARAVVKNSHLKNKSTVYVALPACENDGDVGTKQ